MSGIQGAAVGSLLAEGPKQISHNPFSQVQGMYPELMAGGGEVGKPSEIEGGEMVKTPQGENVMIEGPRHEQGGVPVNQGGDSLQLPAGTQVFSDRIRVPKYSNSGQQIGEQTIAEAKKDNENKLIALQKKVTDNPYDRLAKKALMQQQKANEIMDQQFLALQEQVQAENGGEGQMPEEMRGPSQEMQPQMPQQAMPEMPQGMVPDMAFGGTIPKHAYGYNGQPPFSFNSPEEIKRFQKYIQQNSTLDGIDLGYDLGPGGVDGINGPKTKAAYQRYQDINQIMKGGINTNQGYDASIGINNYKPEAISTLPTKEKISPIESNLTDTITAKLEKRDLNYGKDPFRKMKNSPGEMISIGANMFGALAPLTHTIANSRTDKTVPNYNMDAGLGAIRAAKGNLGFIDDTYEAQKYAVDHSLAKGMKNINTRSHNVNNAAKLGLIAKGVDINNKLLGQKSNNFMRANSQLGAAQDQRQASYSGGQRFADDSNQRNKDIQASNVSMQIANMPRMANAMAAKVDAPMNRNMAMALQGMRTDHNIRFEQGADGLLYIVDGNGNRKNIMG